MEQKGDDVCLDAVLGRLRVSGRYHRRLAALVVVVFTFGTMYCHNYVFAAAPVDYTCKPTVGCDYVQGRNGTRAAADLGRCLQRAPANSSGACADDAPVVPCTAFDYDDDHSFVAEFQLGCSEWRRTLVGTAHSFGYMLGLLAVGPLSDRFGRKMAVVATALVGALAGLARSWVTGYWLYIALEAFEAAFGDSFSPLYMLVIEMVTAKNRALFITIVSFGCQLGGVLNAVAAYSFPYWRHYLRVIYAPSLLLLSYTFLLDESPRWLLNHGRKDEAIAILKKAAKTNKITIEDTVYDKLEYVTENSEDRRSFVALIRSTFASRTLLKRFFICCVWWTSCTFVSYGLAVNSVYLPGNKYLNYGLLAIIEIPASVAMGLSLLYFRRKIPLFSAFFGAAVFFTIQPFLPQDLQWLTILLYVCGRFMTSLAFGITYVFTSELFPTSVRNSMHALCSSIGRTGSILAPQIPLLLQYWSSFPTVLFGGISLVAAGLTLCVPDTAGDELPDTVRQAEVVGVKAEVK